MLLVPLNTAAAEGSDLSTLVQSAAEMLVRTDPRHPAYPFVAGRLAGLAEAAAIETGEDPVAVAKRAEFAARRTARSA